MNIKDLLNKDELEKINKIWQVSEELKSCLYDQKMNTETQKILIRIVDKDIEDLIKCIVDDAFFDCMNNKTEME